MKNYYFLRDILDNVEEHILCFSKTFDVIYVNYLGRRLFLKKNFKIKKKLTIDLLDKEIINIVKRCIEDEEKIENIEFEIQKPQKKSFLVNSFFMTENKSIESYGFVFKENKDTRFKKFKSFNEKALYSLVTLSAGLAHEIKNPLQSLSIYTEIIRRKIQDNDSLKKTNVMNDLDTIESEIRRLNELLENFISFVRPNRKEKKKKNIIKVIKNIIKFLDPIASRNNASIELNAHSNKIDYIMDEDGLKQVFINLIKNSFEAKKENEPLRIDINVFEKGDNIKITIFDNGIGMTKEELDKMLTPFYTTKEKGEGLGMMMVYKVIERHNGYLNIESEKNKYTITEIILPTVSHFIEGKTS